MGAAATSPDESRTLIDALLDDQRTLTAVERFARAHERHEFSSQAKQYRRLLPTAAPASGQQYAFEVDLDQCSGCKACVTACHSLNGLDDTETWRSVGLLISNHTSRIAGSGFQQHITTACHHCVDPGCLNGCPVLAYDKDPVTGIVRHLDDQCIGCQYCVMKCPYNVPQYSSARGIVRKCDMCANRLAVGEAPACVQACPNEAIRITLVETKTVNSQFRNTGTTTFLPGTPDPAITLPTTRYVSARPLPDSLLAGDHARVTPADPHLPLVFMLVLSQLSVGASIAAVFIEPAKWLALVAAMTGSFALAVASLHLGKPLKAWRAFLGWRKSWFSREVIVFGSYAPLAAMNAAAFWFAPLAVLQKGLAITTAGVGLLGVVCSAMIYVDTHREFWRSSECFGKFLGTTLLLGTITTLGVCANGLAITNSLVAALVALLIIGTMAKLGWERRIFHHLVDLNTPVLASLNKSARLLEDQLGLATRGRFACGIFGGIVLPALFLSNRAPALAFAALILCVTGELLERFLFFSAVVPVNMPGGVSA